MPLRSRPGRPVSSSCSDRPCSPAASTQLEHTRLERVSTGGAARGARDPLVARRRRPRPPAATAPDRRAPDASAAPPPRAAKLAAPRLASGSAACAASISLQQRVAHVRARRQPRPRSSQRPPAAPRAASSRIDPLRRRRRTGRTGPASPPPHIRTHRAHVHATAPAHAASSASARHEAAKPRRRQGSVTTSAGHRRQWRIGAQHEAIATPRRQRRFQAEHAAPRPPGARTRTSPEASPTGQQQAPEHHGRPEVHVHAGAVLLRRCVGQDLDVHGQPSRRQDDALAEQHVPTLDLVERRRRPG